MLFQSFGCFVSILHSSKKCKDVFCHITKIFVTCLVFSLSCCKCIQIVRPVFYFYLLLLLNLYLSGLEWLVACVRSLDGLIEIFFVMTNRYLTMIFIKISSGSLVDMPLSTTCRSNSLPHIMIRNLRVY